MNSFSEWELRETEVPDSGKNAQEDCGKAETLFSLANGHLGLRGDFEEPSPSWQRGTYINGFFETEPIIYGELAYGFAKDHQTILNLPDGRVIRLQIDGEEFSMARGSPRSYCRRLDLRRGILDRKLSWIMPSGRRLDLTVRRLVSFTQREAAAISYAFRLHGQNAKVRIISEFDLGSENIKAARDPRVGSKLAEDCLVTRASEVSVLAEMEPGKGNGFPPASCMGLALATVETRNTRLSVTCGAITVLEANGLAFQSAKPSSARDGKRLQILFEGDVVADREVSITKYLVYSGVYSAEAEPERTTQVGENLLALAHNGFEALVLEQASYMEKFWHAADVVIEGDSGLQQAVRFNLFHLLQSAGTDGRSNLAAKGLSGEGYEGHYFWDTEIYALPVFTYTVPYVARQLLMYRHGILDKARERATEMNHKGALFPWRTIGGAEASAYYEAGTAQYHINADIIYAARRYALVSNDRAFIVGPLAEMAVETARFWSDLGDFVERADGLTAREMRIQLAGAFDGVGPEIRPPGRMRTVFCINTVTGPDEYTALVNNNIYTNLMARVNLVWAADLVAWMQRQFPDAYADLKRSLHLDPDEEGGWARAAELMFVPYDEKRGLYPQDDAFFNKGIWDLASTPKEKRPLLLHYHPLEIYRYQVLKQPDLVLAQFLQGDLFTDEEKRANFVHYEPLTSGDSSLSHCIQSIMAVETGDVEKGWKYFKKTVRMDLDDLHGNVRDGIHAAAMAGSWLSIVYGLGGFREHIEAAHAADGLPQQIAYSFKPALPEGIGRLSFRLRLGESLLDADFQRGSEAGGLFATYRLVEGEPVRFRHRESEVTLNAVNRERKFTENCQVDCK